MKVINILLLFSILSYFRVYSQNTFEENGIMYIEDLSDPTKLAVIVVPKVSPDDPITSLYRGSIVIPSKIEHDMDTYEVTGIAKMAFRGENLEELTIQEGPVKVGDYAFNNSALRKLSYPGSARKLSEVYGPVLEQIVLGEGIKEIFSVGGGKLTKINFPSSLVSISDLQVSRLEDEHLVLGPDIIDIARSFSNVNSLGIEINGKTAKIVDSFENCDSLQSLNLVGISDIKNSFEYCHFLTNLNLGVVENLEYSLRELESLTTLTIPESCKKINSSFWECDNLKKLQLSNGILEIKNSFTNTNSLTELNIPSSCKSIVGSFATSNLKELTIPKNCEIIENSFRELKALEILKIEEGVTTIKKSLQHLPKLKALYIPANLCGTIKPGNDLKEVHLTSNDVPEKCPTYIVYPAQEKLLVYVPKGSKDNYAQLWGKQFFFPEKVVLLEE